MNRPMFDPVTVGRYSDGSPVLISRVDAALLDIQGRRLGYTLTVTQGGRHEGGASAGTHGRWRAVDLAPFEAVKKVRAGRNSGGAAFHRTPAQGFEEHVHQATLIRGVDDSAQADDLLALQMRGYRDDPTRDGLGAWPFGIDREYKPDPVVEFDWRAYTEGRYDDSGHLVTRAARRRATALRHNRDIARAVRRLRAARRKAQNPAVTRRLEQFARELLRMRIRPQRHIDTPPH